MKKNKYSTWNPLPGIPTSLILDSIHDDVEGLRFLLRGSDPTLRTLRLRFESPVGYRSINESFRLRTWSDPAYVGGRSSLMIVEKSDWVDELVEESGGVLQSEKLVHYAIYTTEDCIDVVTEFPPQADWPND